MARRKFTEIDTTFQELKSLPTEQKLQQLQRLSKQANARITALEKKGIEYGAIERAKFELSKSGRTRFYEGKKFKTENLLDVQLAQVYSFLKEPTSLTSNTLTIDETVERAFKGGKILVDIPSDKKDLFVKFLHSQEFKSMKKWADSGQILDELNDMLNEGFSYEEINQGFQAFIESETMTLDAISDFVNANRNLLLQ